MPYKDLVISDYPVAFYGLDDFNDINFPQCIDYSGCGNNGTYTGTPESSPLPLVSGNQFSYKADSTNHITLSIENDYTTNPGNGGLATKYYSDNFFSLEAWFLPSIASNFLTPILADPSRGIGLFYKNGNIIFKLESEELNYTLPILDKSLHVVAVYIKDVILIYVDSELVASKTLTSFKFTNATIEFKVGPTYNVNDSFLINNVAIYRYDLNQTQISNHYSKSLGMSPIQICFPENGRLFEIFDDSVSTKYTYSYPANKKWNYFITDDLFYNPDYQELSILQTPSAQSKTVEIIDFVSIPSGITVDSSKVEWSGSNGVSVFISLDGDNYEECTNGAPLPNYKLDNFTEDISFYIKIILSTLDSSKIIPRLSYLAFSFYKDQIFYSLNSGDHIETSYGEAYASNFDIALGKKKYPILSRNKNNGLRVFNGSAFKMRTDLPANTIEFFYTPKTLDASGLILTKGLDAVYDGGIPSQAVFDLIADGGAPNSIQSSTADAGTLDAGYLGAKYIWDSSGSITNENVRLVYVNGINKSAETDIFNVFEENQLHHVVLVLEDFISTEIHFNASIDGSSEALYQNIATYSNQFNEVDILSHYNLYIGAVKVVAEDSSFDMTENTIKYYNNDWKVIQTA